VHGLANRRRKLEGISLSEVQRHRHKIRPSAGAEIKILSVTAGGCKAVVAGEALTRRRRAAADRGRFAGQRLDGGSRTICKESGQREDA